MLISRQEKRAERCNTPPLITADIPDASQSSLRKLYHSRVEHMPVLVIVTQPEHRENTQGGKFPRRISQALLRKEADQNDIDLLDISVAW